MYSKEWLANAIACVQDYNGSVIVTTQDLEIFNNLRRLLVQEPWTGYAHGFGNKDFGYGSLSSWDVGNLEIRFYWHINKPDKPPMHRLVIQKVPTNE